MSKKKKTNLCRIPVTLADVEKVKKEAVITATESVTAIFFTVMRDKEGYGKKRLQRLWKEVDDLSESISQGRVKVNDLIKTLREAGINLNRC